eukprot:NODE_699_length_2823_cov_8.501113.p1 GENE.NODE_699_length_2823_cov_8.501113~~NODE_699_length_2823_cov_8.501113.p1  ORF type:complete len:891 (+),score=227.65 NODE_699_length_2823_cov_8.501113:88-2760(+)
MPRLVVVSNRLPFTLKQEDDQVVVKASSGGLVSAMKTAAQLCESCIWIGWPGFACTEEQQDQYMAYIPAGNIPVFMTQEEVDMFYTGYSNSSLWPLLHTMIPYARFNSAFYATYKKVNQRYADVIEANTRDGDLVWVHDYHLFLVPKMVKDVNRKLRLAFFLHTPFSGYESLRVLPELGSLMRGVLGADLIGFHTLGYLRNFRSTVQRVCGFRAEMTYVDHLYPQGEGHRTKIGVFPIGVNLTDIEDAVQTPEFKQHLDAYTKQFEGKALVLSVERFDYSKGLKQKVQAIHRYLVNARAQLAAEQQQQQNLAVAEPEPVNAFFARIGSSFKSALRLGEKQVQKPRVWCAANTVFIFIAVPTRLEVEEYRAIEREVHELMSITNGEFSTAFNAPLVYIHRPVSPPELIALYARADMCLVTPLVDGMNLVAKEFVASKNKQIPNMVPGTVVLSEFAGAAQELFDAFVVNPYDEVAVAKTIATGLGMGDQERWELVEAMRDAVIENDSHRWGQDILRALQAPTMPGTIRRSASRCLPELTADIAHPFRPSAPGRKVLFLDYDGTLKELNASDTSGGGAPCDDMHDIFRALSPRRDILVVIVSGRTKEFLEEHLGNYNLNFTLVAEHGYHIRHAGESEWNFFSPHTATAWKTQILPTMQLFVRYTPKSSIEEKDASLVWHYGDCDAEFGNLKATELTHFLLQSCSNLPCEVTRGHGIVECSSIQTKKGIVVSAMILSAEASKTPFESVLVVGDDLTDESMFASAPEAAITVKVGHGETMAKHVVSSPREVRAFLREILTDRRARRVRIEEKEAPFQSCAAPSLAVRRSDEDAEAFQSCRAESLASGSRETRRSRADKSGQEPEFQSCHSTRQRKQTDDEFAGLGDCEESGVKES